MPLDDIKSVVGKRWMRRGIQAGLILGYLAWCFLFVLLDLTTQSYFFSISIALMFILFGWVGSWAGFTSSLISSLLGFAVWNGSRWEMLLQVAILWGAWGILHSFYSRHESSLIDSYLEIQELEKEKKHVEDEVHFYRRRASEAAGKTSHRRLLSAAAKELGSALDPEAILTRLQSLCRDLFPRGAPHFSRASGSDAIDRWVVSRRQPLVIPDIAQDARFHGSVSPALRSVIAVPVAVGGNLAGIMRVESERSEVFGRDELRVLDMLSGLAALALENAALFGRVKTLSLRDGLTGLYTQRVFWERLEEEILRAGRYNHPLSLIMCDIDHFKVINDTYGHQAGDACLVRVSQMFQIKIRPVDMAARYGGEEFALILPQIPHKKAVSQAEEIREAIFRDEIVFSGQKISLTCSFGVVTFPREATTGRALMRLADERLYQAKRSGRNRVVSSGNDS